MCANDSHGRKRKLKLKRHYFSHKPLRFRRLGPCFFTTIDRSFSASVDVAADTSSKALLWSLILVINVPCTYSEGTSTQRSKVQIRRLLAMLFVKLSMKPGHWSVH